MANRGLSVEDAQRQARALLDARVQSVTALVKVRQQLADFQAQVEQVEREDVRLYSAALADGWTADELRRLGLAEPAKKARARRRTTAARRSGASTSASQEAPADSPNGEHL